MQIGNVRVSVRSRTPFQCRVCGCTDRQPCRGGCYWVEPDLCSRCAAKIERSEARQ